MWYTTKELDRIELLFFYREQDITFFSDHRGKVTCANKKNCLGATISSSYFSVIPAATVAVFEYVTSHGPPGKLL